MIMQAQVEAMRGQLDVLTQQIVDLGGSEAPPQVTSAQGSSNIGLGSGAVSGNHRPRLQLCSSKVARPVSEWQSVVG